MEQDAHPTFSLGSLGFALSTPSRKPLLPPPPCVEVQLSEVSEPLDSHLESIVINDDLTLLKGRINTGDVFGTSNSDLVPGKYEGGLKLWEGSVDLVKCLYSEVRDGRLSLAGRRVLELGCGHGLPGIYACLQGAAVVHFQDFNAEVLKCLTIMNVKSNLTKEQSQSKSTSQDMANSEIKVNPSTKVQFFSGDWSEVHHLLFHGGDDKDQEGTRVSTEQDQYASYDVILMAETVYSLSSLGDLYGLIKKCLNHQNGVVYMAGKKHYFGVGGGTRQFIHMVNEDGVMLGSLLSEVADGSSNLVGWTELWCMGMGMEVSVGPVGCRFRPRRCARPARSCPSLDFFCSLRVSYISSSNFLLWRLGREGSGVLVSKKNRGGVKMCVLVSRKTHHTQLETFYEGF